MFKMFSDSEEESFQFNDGLGLHGFNVQENYIPPLISPNFFDNNGISFFGQEIFKEYNQGQTFGENDNFQLESGLDITNEEKNVNYENIFELQNKIFNDGSKMSPKIINKITEEKISDIITNQDKTKDTSKENSQTKPVLLPFVTKKPLKRIDYLEKKYKTYFSSFIKNYGNGLIQTSELPQKLKKMKLSSPNYVSFTGNPKEKDNYIFLSFSIKQIFSYYKNENCKISHQLKNQKVIDNILEYIDGVKNSQIFENLKNFFNMSLEDGYRLFEESKFFENFCKDDKTIFLDKEFKAEKGFSIRKKNGFVHLTKMYSKKE